MIGQLASLVCPRDHQSCTMHNTTRKSRHAPRGEHRSAEHDTGPGSSTDPAAKRTRSIPDAEGSTADIEVNVVQGGERRGWLRANDRTMILDLTFQHLSSEEKRRWLAALGGAQGEAAEVDLALRYDDRTAVAGKKRGQYPERVRLIKFESSVKSDSDVVMLFDNALTLVSRDGNLYLKQDQKISNISEFFKVTEDRGRLSLKFKLTTNITSKSHENRSFRFTASARRGNSLNYLGTPLQGESFDFELVAKHRTEAKSKAPVHRSPPQQPRAAPQELVPQIQLYSAETQGKPGDLLTCTGSVDITKQNVVAELTMDSNKRRGKRKHSTTDTRRLQPLREHCSAKVFVTQLPLDLPAGGYHVQMVCTKGKLKSSQSQPIHVIQPNTEGLRATRAMTRSESELELVAIVENIDNPGELRRQHSNTLFKCDSSLALSKQFSTSWPQAKALGDDLLPQSEVPQPHPGNPSLDLIPSNSELNLSYIQSANPPGAVLGGLTRSISDENLAKIAANVEIYRGSEFDLLTRNTWLTGPNNPIPESLTPAPAEGMQVDEPAETNMVRTRSRSLCRQTSENNVFSSFLVADDTAAA